MAKNGKGNLEDEIDALFKLPLTEFTPARNTLASQLKKDGRANDANLVKSLTKPSISAWAVNQLYWHHRQEFDSLIATGQRYRQAQKSRTTGKIADVRGSLDARRNSLNDLTELATELLQEAGSNPAPDTIRRITTTLEALSAYSSVSDGPTPGRLTNDVDPPGFESLASLFAGSVAMKAKTEPARSAPAQKPSKSSSQSVDLQKKRELEQTRQIKIAAAKLAIQNAKRSLTEAKAKVQRLESAQKKVQAEAKQAEKELREAEQRFKKAKFIAEDAKQSYENVLAETAEAKREAEDARREVDHASKELEVLFREN